MLTTYLPLGILVLLAVGLGFLVVGLGHSFGPRRPTERKGAPYESGMVPYGTAARRISVRYYLMAVIFILFDIEVVFFMPWAVIFKSLGVPGLIGMLIFIGVLVVGYIYAWKKGALEWE
jgi:NADH-quinone oxidoreductase subunit A